MAHAVEYDALASALQRAGAPAGAAESHGLLCGILCAGGEVDRGVWLTEVLGGPPDDAYSPARESVQLLDHVCERTLEQIHEGQMAFQLLLPPDERSLSERAAALRDWCQGFLAGFALGGRGHRDALPGDVQELLSDLVEFTKAETEVAEDSEDEEDAYAQLVEYVRVGAMLIFEELARGDRPLLH
ncbi:MAG: UPF0149 family protein [Gammaproteobacteria bacterium]|nr:UPF0149 family protein [Gammaproteobacteria bacterium]NIR98427.1 UPF0149 family protein [Gammaproteobacteria bacterium]NIT64174.1 UPF0149 family protein [Gammaproteobacteria bacterium]NIV21114.1 UPF0149 family protein [Gammaproteobacteria bacterium]NIX10591.1 UPF0149 family protein [Gammaproteobacteria bacterium]